MRGTIAIALGFLVAGCSENARETGPPATGGTLVIATTQDPGALFPPYILTVAAKQIAEQLYDYLADVGTNFDARDEKSYRAELAKGWRWSSDSMNIAFQLDPRARWHDGRSVTAGDVRFTFDLNKDTTVASRYISSLANIDSVSVTDSLTAVFWFHRRAPTQFLDAAAQLLILPAHQLERIPRERLRERLPPPIGSGRFRLRRWVKGTAVEIVADTGNYRGRAILDRVIWSPTPDFNAAFARLMGGEADLFDGLRPENVKEMARRRNLRAIGLPGAAYAFLRFGPTPHDPIHFSAIAIFAARWRCRSIVPRWCGACSIPLRPFRWARQFGLFQRLTRVLFNYPSTLRVQQNCSTRWAGSAPPMVSGRRTEGSFRSTFSLQRTV